MAYFIFFSFAEYIQRSVLLLIVHGSQLTKTVLPSHCQIYILDNLWSHNVHSSMAPVCRWMQLELLLSIEYSRIYYRGLLLRFTAVFCLYSCILTGLEGFGSSPRKDGHSHYGEAVADCNCKGAMFCVT